MEPYFHLLESWLGEQLVLSNRMWQKWSQATSEAEPLESCGSHPPLRTAHFLEARSHIRGLSLQALEGHAQNQQGQPGLLEGAKYQQFSPQSPKTIKLFFFYFFSSLKGTLFIYIYWTIVDLQCFVSFWCMAAILFQIFSHYRLSKDNEYSSLCYTVGPCLSILNKVICIC